MLKKLVWQGMGYMRAVEKIYENQYFNLDVNKKLFLSSIINYFQDLFVKVSLAEESGKGIEYMNDKNLTWIIYRWQLKLYKHNYIREDFKVVMTPSAYKRSYLNVKFEMFSENGEKVAEAFSLWILLDMKEGRPYKGEDEDENIRKIFNLSIDENRIDTMKNTDVFRKIETIEDMYNEKIFNVGYGDIDTNKHANNSRYISWMIEPIAQYLLEGYEISEIKISYRKPAKYGDMVRAVCSIEEGADSIKSFNKIMDKDDSIFAAAEILIKNK